MVLNPESGSVYEVTFLMQLNLLSGVYTFGVWVQSGDFKRLFDWIPNAVTITVTDDYSHGGVADLNPSCSVVERNNEI